INTECRPVSSVQQVTVLFVGVDDLSSTIDVALSPNPTNGILILNSNDASSNYTIQISDVQGRIVLERKSVHANDQIEITEFDKGIYFYRVSNEKGVRKGRVIKE
ncbi:MAG: T9SS type A sorting domain-containing protein, partial [Bacteroidia bacterium]|nr:T9SS type A sorting domain-containing protein [Bacteroidia bacterium]